MSSYWLKRTADAVVHVSYQFSQQEHGPTPHELRQQFPRLLGQTDPCTAAGCGYEIMLSNAWLARFHLAPYTALRSYFWAKDDALDANQLVFWTMGSKGRMVVATVETKYCEGCERFNVVPCSDLDEGIASGSIETEYRSTDPRNRSAFGLNTTCLTGLHGRDTVADLIPTVWQAERAGAIRCRLKKELH